MYKGARRVAVRRGLEKLSQGRKKPMPNLELSEVTKIKRAIVEESHYTYAPIYYIYAPRFTTYTPPQKRFSFRICATRRYFIFGVTVTQSYVFSGRMFYFSAINKHSPDNHLHLLLPTTTTSPVLFLLIYCLYLLLLLLLHPRRRSSLTSLSPSS